MSFYSNSSAFELFIEVIPHSIGWFIVVNIIYTNIVWQLIYFYLIVLYLKSKLNEVNRRLSKLKNKRYRNFCPIISEFNTIFEEISEYNRNYWSHFILIVWMVCVVLLSSVTFLLIFGRMALIMRLIVLYFDLFFIFVILFVIKICGSIYLETKNTYKLLNYVISKGYKQSPKQLIKVIYLN